VWPACGECSSTSTMNSSRATTSARTWRRLLGHQAEVRAGCPVEDCTSVFPSEAGSRYRGPSACGRGHCGAFGPGDESRDTSPTKVAALVGVSVADLRAGRP
jgi:hypothetical protein